MSDSFVTPWTIDPRLLCPWDFPGKNTGVGCHFFLQGILSTQGLNPSLLHWQADSLPLSHLGSPARYIADKYLKINLTKDIQNPAEKTIKFHCVI